MGLIETGLQAQYTEADPFAPTPDPVLKGLTPLGRVPVLQHADFTLTETAAILRYLDQIGDGPSLVPQDARAAAQMAQVIGIVDFYGYVPLVRDVFAHGYYYALVGETPDPERLQRGLRNAEPVLRVLDAIAAEGRVLGGAGFSLADIHLAPMIDYFVTVPAGSQCFARYQRFVVGGKRHANDPLWSQLTLRHSNSGQKYLHFPLCGTLTIG